MLMTFMISVKSKCKMFIKNDVATNVRYFYMAKKQLMMNPKTNDF